ncbi:Gfo/Idh/MocA family protein [Lysobacter auxotrophicus]|uniref:Gfo/Idh/MocA family oxidoreductase n=1 Tax=Lysobacter auxotrophicus TaxID=2992573 RepID=A0ABN6UI54_9GAMM|nr:Gfo/Idh/MocA family oxidoreductase [Lysobacter auxotrophicus]BDU15994.1 Gfo/Idh/MocA family oxidoreductase [Lysobacter auxotrophicus]
MNARLQPAARAPRLGFLGLGWIGCQRMQVLAGSGIASIGAIADSNPDCLARAAPSAPDARQCRNLDELLAMDELDGVVIATPSGAHAVQAIAALDRGLAVFCQKPLTRTALEARQVVDAARRADRLLEVDFSYRYLDGVADLRERMQRGEFGDIHAIDLVFHNAYGPDKPWFYDLSQSGGGCVMDLGIHLVDLAQWMCGAAGHSQLSAMLQAAGRPLHAPQREVEDYATAQWRLDNNASVRMACSWRLHAGRDAVIEAAFYGTRGGAAIRNVTGSFYDFTVDVFDGTRSTRTASPPDAWGGRTLIEWARRVGAGEGFDPQAESLVGVARTVDAIYGR